MKKLPFHLKLSWWNYYLSSSIWICKGRMMQQRHNAKLNFYFVFFGIIIFNLLSKLYDSIVLLKCINYLSISWKIVFNDLIPHVQLTIKWLFPAWKGKSEQMMKSILLVVILGLHLLYQTLTKRNKKPFSLQTIAELDLLHLEFENFLLHEWFYIKEWMRLKSAQIDAS